MYTGPVLVADGYAGEESRTGPRCGPAANDERVPRHAQRFRPQHARFRHYARLYQLTRVRPAGAAPFLVKLN